MINITDGESQDGDPIPYADAVKELATSDGNVLLFNCHLSMTAADSFLFPASDEILPDELARVLFKMSSVLPETMHKIATNLGVELAAERPRHGLQRRRRDLDQVPRFGHEESGVAMIVGSPHPALTMLQRKGKQT